jgi:hypothetical protein
MPPLIFLHLCSWLAACQPALIQAGRKDSKVVAKTVTMAGTVDSAERNPDWAHVDSLSQNECQALVALYDSMDGQNWAESSISLTPCLWYSCALLLAPVSTWSTTYSTKQSTVFLELILPKKSIVSHLLTRIAMVPCQLQFKTRI